MNFSLAQHEVYTDASVGHHYGRPVGGIAWIDSDGQYEVGTHVTRVPLVAELAAIHLALLAHPGRPVTVVSDCRPALKALDHAARTGVIALPPSPGGNREAARLVHRIGLERQGRAVTLRWVKGHAGHPLNEAADRLAVQARRCVQNGGRLRDIAVLAERIAADVRIPAPRRAS
ncbi:RNase H family protein [Pseudonocardia xishanensis]|uniref:RNase H type-1 domain-containing protein n=1 Tax=Pseudonocardia xishanensis TaxID=630995 RepID=A0ABP8RC85_9PSEU